MSDHDREMLVEPAQLSSQLDAPDLRIVDASWYLPAAGRDGRAEYEAGHLPGAVYLDLSTDLADPSAPVRNTVAAPAALARAFERAGIGTDHRVVLYDRQNGYSAGRIWWSSAPRAPPIPTRCGPRPTNGPADTKTPPPT